jgi:demethylmenaquinone methyltransferase/2-methoxy-6-polyprenyl-1,4-benzoquinol methylase
MNLETSMVAYYAERANEYERIYEKPERQEQLGELKRLVRGTFAGRRVLEAACGTGYWTAVAAETAAHITAFDANEAVLALARAKRLDPRHVQFLLGDAYEPPPFAERFDAALVAFWWSHMPRKRVGGFLERLHVLLEPGAVVLCLDNTYVPGDSTPVTRVDGDGNSFQTRRLENGHEFEVLKNYPTEDELRTAVGAVAASVEVKWLWHYWMLSYRLRA